MATIINPSTESPLNSEIASDCGMDSLSKSDKVLLKRTPPHNNNFKVDYVSVSDQYTPKTGLRGRKTFAFWTLVCLLFLLAVGNLILTFTILGVLRLGQGMESLELVPEASVIKFYGNTDLDRLYKRDGKFEGFQDEPVEIDGNNGAVLFNIVGKNKRPENKLRMERNGTTIRGINKLEIVDPNNGHKIFSTASPNFKIQNNIDQLDVKMVSTNRIASPINENLQFRSGYTAHLRGTEGTNMESKEIVWSADQDIYLKSINGSIVLSASNGIFIDIKNIPIASGKYGNMVTSQFKVCVCMPQGKLFRIPVPAGQGIRVSCTHINMAPPHNPCM